MISILFLSLLSAPSQCRLVATTGGKIFSPSLVQHIRADTNNEDDEVEDHGNRRCFKKVMMVEQLEYQDVETCNHSYDKVSPSLPPCKAVSTKHQLQLKGFL